METKFTKTLLAWHAACGRHDLPWQVRDDWYARILSEVMLQQTQVKTVIPYFERFMAAYPTAADLAAADDEDVMALWAGLGYYSRARNLLKAVRTVMTEWNGECPPDAASLATLPGIGPSTAGAVSAFVNKERSIMADGNAKRVIARVFAIPGHPGLRSFEDAVWKKAGELLPESAEMPAYTQGLMDMGALVCRRNPDCGACPMEDFCLARVRGLQAEIPGRKPRKERPVRHALAWFILDEDAVWVKKQDGRGVWHALWIPPMTEFDPVDGYSMEVPAEFASVVASTKAAPVITHDFSHYRLEIYPVVCRLVPGTVPGGLTRLPLDALDSLALPSPVRAFLSGFEPFDLKP